MPQWEATTQHVRQAYLSYWLNRMRLGMPEEIDMLIQRVQYLLLMAGEHPADHMHLIYVDESGQLVRSWLMTREAFYLLISQLPVKDARVAKFIFNIFQYV